MLAINLICSTYQNIKWAIFRNILNSHKFSTIRLINLSTNQPRSAMATKGTRTRRNIIEKSMQLFSVKGYYNTSVSDILAATDLTKGGLYGHFASKEEIWYAVYEKEAANFIIISFR